MKEILESIILNLVDDKDSVVITEKKDDLGAVYEVKVADSDMGRVIGRQGKNANAIRTIMKSLASKERKKVLIEFAD